MAHSLALPLPAIPEVPAVPVIPLRAVVPWALFAGLLALVFLYFVGAEQGAFSLFSGTGFPRAGARRTTPARRSVPLPPGRGPAGHGAVGHGGVTWSAPC